MTRYKIYLAGAMSTGSKGMLTFEEMNGWRKIKQKHYLS